MVMGSSLLALAMTAIGAGPEPGDEPISCQVRVLTMNGLGWRSAYYSRLQPVARRGTSAVWTADRTLAESMTSEALRATVAPVCTNPGQTSVEMTSRVHYVGHAERLADGPINGATAVAWKPEPSSVEEGFRARVSGRKLDQGILARVALEESHVKALHVVQMAETVPTIAPKPSDPRPSTEEILGKFAEAVQLKLFGEARNLGILVADPAQTLVVESKTLHQPGRRVAVQVQVPEVSHVEVEGEWLVPNHGVLLVSLGVETVADDQERASVRERVALIEVEAAPPGMAMTRPYFERGRPWLPPTPLAATPPLPSRTMPIAVDPQGKVVDLPPLPEAVASAELDRIKPDPEQASPQSPHMTVETAVARAVGDTRRFEFIRTAPLGSAGDFVAMPTPVLPAPSLPGSTHLEAPTVDLPPLPEAVASADLNRIGPKPALPGRPVVSVPIRDAQLARTGFDTPDGVGPAPEVPESSSRPILARVAEILAEFAEEARTAGGECVEACPSRPDAQSTTGQGKANGSTADRDKAATAPVVKTLGLGVTVTDRDGSNVLKASKALGSALKNPGTTETQYLPIGEKFTLEIKATVVPRTSGLYNSSKKDDAPAANP